MRLWTASATDRVMRCPASAVLPQHRSETDESRAGDARHQFLERAPEVGRDAALAEVPDAYREQCEALDLSMMPQRLAHEVAFAIDVETGEARELGRGVERRYDVADTEIPGTADVVGVSEAQVCVIDFKGPDPRVPRAKDSGQLKTLALAAARAYGKEEAVVSFIRIRGHESWQDTATLDIFDLDCHAADLKATASLVDKARDNPDKYIREGSWCRYCPAMPSCPAKQALQRQAESGEILDTLAPLTPETAPEAYRKLRLMEDMTKRVREHVCAYAREQPIDLGEGRKFGLRPTRGQTKLDGDVIYEVAREKLGQDVADKMVTRSATQKAIGDALNGTEGKTKIAKEILAEAERRGGVRKTSGGEKLDEYEEK